MMQELKIRNKTAKLPIIQGGMGVGVSLSGLAGAVAAEGGIGVISTAQIGFDEDGFETDQKASKIPYCITDALIRAVKGDVDNGLIFCGANVGKITKMSTVHEVMAELSV